MVKPRPFHGRVPSSILGGATNSIVIEYKLLTKPDFNKWKIKNIEKWENITHYILDTSYIIFWSGAFIYRGGGAKAARWAHNPETRFESYVRNHIFLGSSAGRAAHC